MLFEMLDDVSKKINQINVVEEAPRFARQLREMKPTLENDLRSDGVATEKLEDFILGMANIQLWIIKGIPAIAKEMREMLQSGAGEPAFRTVVAASLAYLVQPNDLLPDDLPGAYGFIDDALLINEASALSWEISGDMKRAEEKRKNFQFSFNLVPDRKKEEFQAAISGLAMNLNLMRYLDPSLAEMTTQMLIANPLQPITPQGGLTHPPAADGFGAQFTGNAGAGRPRYTWTDGDSMGVNFPDGGGVATDGRDIFIL